MADTAPAYKLAYGEAIRALEQQQRRVDNLRTRAGILLSAAAIATSFLGGKALEGRAPTAWGWAAVALFAALSGVALLILWPRDEWKFAIGIRELFQDYVEAEEPLPITTIHRDLALHMEDSYFENERGLNVLIWAFRLGCGLLSAEVVAWIIDIAVTS